MFDGYFNVRIGFIQIEHTVLRWLRCFFRCSLYFFFLVLVHTVYFMFVYIHIPNQKGKQGKHSYILPLTPNSIDHSDPPDQSAHLRSVFFWFHNSVFGLQAIDNNNHIHNGLRTIVRSSC